MVICARSTSNVLPSWVSRDRVTFLGTVTGAAKGKLLSSASVLIAYPTTSNDAFPTVLLEAWAARVPVIAAEIGALRTLVHQGVDGLLVAPSQPEALARAMAYLMEDSADAVRYGENGRRRMKDFTWESQAIRFEELVGAVESSRSKARGRG